MNTHPKQPHRYGDWRDMTVEEVRDWLHLQVTSWWRYVTLMDQYDDHPTKGGLHPQRGTAAGGASATEPPKTLQRTALNHIA